MWLKVSHLFIPPKIISRPLHLFFQRHSHFFYIPSATFSFLTHHLHPIIRHFFFFTLLSLYYLPPTPTRILYLYTTLLRHRFNEGILSVLYCIRIEYYTYMTSRFAFPTFIGCIDDVQYWYNIYCRWKPNRQKIHYAKSQRWFQKAIVKEPFSIENPSTQKTVINAKGRASGTAIYVYVYCT